MTSPEHRGDHVPSLTSLPSTAIPSPPAPAPVSYPVATASSSSESGIQLSRDADLLINSFLPSPSAAQPPPPYEAKGLPLPFCAPQIAASFDSPFATVESAVGISQDQLLAFIDGLNLAMTASPPLRVVNVAGKIIGYMCVPSLQLTPPVRITGQ
ncbi:hypothetical protein C8J57DRAFT_505776 [Mycena rebaudengoi]|nr:hypothetical protein C8J57DRAFT_505776 [Mycena rebaudengoi]